LKEAIKLGKGSVKIATYPPSPYLTQLVVRVLRRREKLSELRTGRQQLVLERTDLGNLRWLRPRARHRRFCFCVPSDARYCWYSHLRNQPRKEKYPACGAPNRIDCQLTDGTWPLSKPLFHYPKLEMLHCYEFEMLAQLLMEQKLEDLLLEYLPNLSRATKSLLESEIPTGHRRQRMGRQGTTPIGGARILDTASSITSYRGWTVCWQRPFDVSSFVISIKSPDCG